MINDVCTEQLFGYLLIQHWWNKFSTLCSFNVPLLIPTFLLRIKKIDECAVLIFFFLQCFVDFVFLLLTKVELVNIIHNTISKYVFKYIHHWRAIAFNLSLSNQFHTPLINYFEIRFDIIVHMICFHIFLVCRSFFLWFPSYHHCNHLLIYEPYPVDAI